MWSGARDAASRPIPSVASADAGASQRPVPKEVPVLASRADAASGKKAVKFESVPASGSEEQEAKRALREALVRCLGVRHTSDRVCVDVLSCVTCHDEY